MYRTYMLHGATNKSGYIGDITAENNFKMNRVAITNLLLGYFEAILVMLATALLFLLLPLPRPIIRALFDRNLFVFFYLLCFLLFVALAAITHENT